MSQVRVTRDDPSHVWYLRAEVQDGLFVAGIVLLSSALYLPALGFSSDDWSVLGYASASEDQSYGGIYRAIFGPLVQMRPVQFLYLAALYKAFGADPLGYHIVNTLVLVAGAVMFYLVLRRVGASRVLALAVPLVYALLPHYSTNKLWLAAFQIGLSMTLYFLSLYADLRAGTEMDRRYAVWKPLALLALVGSALAYELVLPLLIVNPLVVWYVERRRSAPTSHRTSLRALAAAALSNALALAAIAVFKVATTSRADFGADDPVWHLKWFYGLMRGNVRVGFVEYGLELPLRLLHVAQHYFDGPTFGVGLALGFLVFFYLNRAARQEGSGLADRRRMIVVGVLGLVVFGLGYAIFLTNYNAFATATGIANRVAMAGSVGVALCFVAAVGLLSSLLPSSDGRRRGFAALVAFIAASGFILTTTIASFWVEAYEQEQHVLAAIYDHFPTLPKGSTVLLDGICPYVGPAVVFESNWDLEGALLMHYRDYELQADVIAHTTKLEADALSTSIYADGIGEGIYTRYPYGEHVYVYDVVRDASTTLPDAEAARTYFQTYNPDFNAACPEGRAGYGVSIF